MTKHSDALLEQPGGSRFIAVLFYLAALAVVPAIAWDTGFSKRELSPIELVIVFLLSVPAGFVLAVSLIGLISYFLFLPSISQDSHLFLRVHSRHLIHPLNTSIVLGLAALWVYSGSPIGGAVWIGLCTLHMFQTFLIVRLIRREHLMNGPTGSGPGSLFLLLNLFLGTKIVTVAGGAKPLSPWRLDTLPEDTWIVDVRTKSEFNWNRLQGAENYPWGKGVIEAAKGKPKDRPVLVMCLSGHRSPSVAVMLRKLGFKTVYHLSWGLLYLILIGRSKKGLFFLTRPHRDPARRSEDLKGITIGYITLGTIVLILAPLDHFVSQTHVSGWQRILGALIGLTGLMLIGLSYRALGRNFRVFAAPRRGGTLVTSGVYSKVRHPMYSSVITLLVGWVLFFGSLWSVPFWLVFSLLYVVKAIKEERILIDRFAEYEEYRKRTRRFLPYIY